MDSYHHIKITINSWLHSGLSTFPLIFLPRTINQQGSKRTRPLS